MHTNHQRRDNPTVIPQRSGPVLVSPPVAEAVTVWKVTLLENLEPRQSAVAAIWKCPSPDADPVQTTDQVRVFDLLMTGNQTIPAGIECLVIYAYRRYVLFGMEC